MGGLALGVGMLLDNSIVVLDNIVRLRAQGKSKYQAAIVGAKQMGGAIFAATVTTIVVFLPFLFLQGIASQIFWDLALTISFSLLASLLAAIMIIPMAYTTFLGNKPAKKEIKVERVVKQSYAKALNFALNNKIFVGLIVLVLVIGSVLIAFNFDLEMFPDSFMGSITVEYHFNTTHMSVNDITWEAAHKKAIKDIVELADEFEDVDAVGISESTGLTIAGITIGGGALQAALTVVPYRQRRQDPLLMIGELERQLNLRGGALYRVQLSMVSVMTLIDFGDLVNTIPVYVTGNDHRALTAASQNLRDMLNDIDGVDLVSVSGGTMADFGAGMGLDVAGAEEHRLIINKDAASRAGLTVAEVYLQIDEWLNVPGVVQNINIREGQSGENANYGIVIYMPRHNPRAWFVDNNGNRIYFANNTQKDIEYFVTNNTNQAKIITQGIGAAQTHRMVLPNEQIPVVRSGNNFSYNYLTPGTTTPRTAVFALREREDGGVDDTIFFDNDVSVNSNQLLNMPIRTQGMAATNFVSLYSLLDDASFTDASRTKLATHEGATDILRINRQNTIIFNVVYSEHANARQVRQLVQTAIAEFNEATAGISATTEGHVTIMDEVFRHLFMVLAVAVALIFLIMVAQFGSWKLPLIIFTTVPLAFVGGFYMLAMAGLNLSIMALMGLIIVMGVATTTGIVFVDYAKRLVEEGLPKREALLRAGMDRLRPIMMTELSTIFALIAMAADNTDLGAVLRPLAIAAIGGLLFTMFVSLFIVPIMFDLIYTKSKRVMERKLALAKEDLRVDEGAEPFDDESPEQKAFVHELACHNCGLIHLIKSRLDTKIGVVDIEDGADINEFLDAVTEDENTNEQD
jgi:multidrug efflux pump subunit AcrB